MSEDKKPILYIDYDGVLTGKYDGFLQVRPGVVTFIRWALAHFECRWLTCMSEAEMENAMRVLNLGMLRRHIKYWNWPHGRDKADSINLKEDFYWAEDGIGKYAENVLFKAGKLNRYVRVPSEGKDNLFDLINQLEQILYERSKDYEPERLWCGCRTDEGCICYTRQ